MSPPVGRTFTYRHLYYYSTIRLILIYHPSEGGSPSRPRHCSQCAARVQSCVSQWFSWKHKLLSAARFEPGSSRAAGKRVTTRPLRPTNYKHGITELTDKASEWVSTVWRPTRHTISAGRYQLDIHEPARTIETFAHFLSCVEQSVSQLALTAHLRRPFAKEVKDVSLPCCLVTAHLLLRRI